MQKGRGCFSILCLVVFIGLGLSGEVYAFELMDGKLKLNGFVRNETGVRLKEHIWYDAILSAPPPQGIGENASTQNAIAEEDKLSVMRSTLQVEGDCDITTDLRFRFIVRGHYDAKWDLDGSIDTANDFFGNEIWGPDDLRAEPDGEYLEKDIDLREYYFSWNPGNFVIRAGRQQIVWGEADAIRISDIINPLNFARDFTTSAYGYEWEDVRIPQRMVDIIYVLPESPHQYEFELVLNPEDSEVNTDAPYGELYYGKPGNQSFIPTNFLLTGIIGLPPLPFTPSSQYEAFDKAMDDALPENNSNRFAGGVRLRGVFGAWDTHLFYYYQRVQRPIFTSSGNFSLIDAGFPIPFPWDVFDDTLGIKGHYPHINTLGGTFNYFNDPLKTVFRGEFGYIIDHPYTGLRQGIDPTHLYDPDGPGPAPLIPVDWGGWFYSDVVEKDTIQYMIGFDRPTWIPFLNRTKTFFITGQFFHKIILNYDDNVKGENNKLLLDTVMGKDGSSDHQYLFSLKMNTGYHDDRIKPDILVVWDVNGHSGFVRPALGWEPTYDWRIELGNLYFWADTETGGPFGWVKDDDQIYGMIERRF